MRPTVGTVVQYWHKAGTTRYNYIVVRERNEEWEEAREEGVMDVCILPATHVNPRICFDNSHWIDYPMENFHTEVVLSNRGKDG